MNIKIFIFLTIRLTACSSYQGIFQSLVLIRDWNMPWNLLKKTDKN